MKFGTGALLAAVLLAVVFFSLGEDTEQTADKENEEEMKITAAPWFNEGDPWFDEGDELNRLSSDELSSLAEKNETIRKMLEEDKKIELVQIESLEDLEHLPENYPEDLKKLMIENYLEKQNISQQTANSSQNDT